MTRAISLELLAFNLKLLGRQSRKSLLISAGQPEDKKRMLPAIRRLLGLDIDLHATPGTHKFLLENGINSTLIHKITDGHAPNILTFLKAGRFDLVINILTGDEDYDEDFGRQAHSQALDRERYSPDHGLQRRNCDA